MQPRLSLVCPLHNCLEYTQVLLQDLEATLPQRAQTEIILVDDASSDGTRAFLEPLAGQPGYQVVKNDRNLGYAASNNRGVALAQSDTLVLLNNDLQLASGWLEPMLELLESLPAAGAVGNVQRNIANGLVDHAGIFFGLDGMPTHAHKNRRQPPPGNWIERNAVTAACMAIGRQDFLAAGGFDEGYRNGFEDVDLCMKLKQAGKRHYVALRSIVGHHVSASPGRHRRNEQNSERFRARWSKFAQRFGREEWPREYLRRYARLWWRMEPILACKALLMLASPSKGAHSLDSG